MVACGEAAPKGEAHGDDDPGTRWGRQSSDAQSEVDLKEVVFAGVAPGLVFVLGKILLVMVLQVSATLLKNRGEVALLANVTASSCKGCQETCPRWSWWVR